MKSMFYTVDGAVRTINRQLTAASEKTICRDVFYKLRRNYVRLYRQPDRLVITDALVLYVYFCAKAQNRIQRYAILAAYMQEVDSELEKRGLQFCDQYGSFSAIDTHFLNATPIVA